MSERKSAFIHDLVQAKATQTNQQAKLDEAIQFEQLVADVAAKQSDADMLASMRVYFQYHGVAFVNSAGERPTSIGNISEDSWRELVEKVEYIDQLYAMAIKVLVWEERREQQ